MVVGGAGVAVSSGRWVEQGWDLCIRLYPSIQRRYSRFNSLVKSSWEFYYICTYVRTYMVSVAIICALPFPPLSLSLLFPFFFSPPLPYLSQVIPGGAAAKDGRLVVGQRILEVNAQSLLGASHMDAVRALRGVQEKLTMLVCDGFKPEELEQSMPISKSEFSSGNTSDVYLCQLLLYVRTCVCTYVCMYVCMWLLVSCLRVNCKTLELS